MTAPDMHEGEGDLGTVLITGMGGRLGGRLLRRLHRKRKVVGVGQRPALGLPKDVEYHLVDPLRSAAREVFARPDVKAIVHLGVIHDSRRRGSHQNNLLTLERVLGYAEQFGIRKVVLLSSANTYGPRPENPQFLREDAPLLASGRFTEMRSLVEVDLFAQSYFWRRPDTEIVILRPAHVLGTVRNAPSNYLRLALVPTVLGFDPMLQAVHQDDVTQAIERALMPGIRGIYNIAGPPPVPLSKALRVLGRRSVGIPYSLAKSGLTGLFQFGMTHFPAAELDFIRFVCMVDDGAARSVLGYAPQHDLRETLLSVDEERWA
jgi:UDP-glucose 4-epimerase